VPFATQAPQRLVAAFATLVLISCAGSDSTGPRVASLHITASADSVEVGDTLQLTAAMVDSNSQAISGVAVTWTSLDTSIVLVSTTGIVLGRDTGATRIVAVAQGQRDTLRIRVIVPVASVTILTRVPGMVVSDTIQMTAIPKDAAGHALPRTIAWSSSDPAVLTVSTAGSMAALTPGTAILTARAGRQSDTLSVRSLRVSFTRLNAGRSHTCGVTSDGDALCWGTGGLAVVPIGAPRRRPGLVVGGQHWLSVVAGDEGSCGVSVSHRVYCWGPVTLTAPDMVPGMPLATAVAVQCALSTVGEAWCWGLDWLTTTATNLNPGRVITAFSAKGLACGLGTDSIAYCGQISSAGLQPIPGGLHFATVGAGVSHACALTAAGTAWCWGEGTNGRLGNGDVQSSATPVAVVGGHVFRLITGGDGHTCGIDTTGAAWCWGSNNVGQLGTGSIAVDHYDTPQPVTGGLTWSWLDAGFAATCGITTAGVAYCWGFNNAGQLGNGTTASSAAPVRVAGQL